MRTRGTQMKRVEKDEHHHEVNLVLLNMLLLRPYLVDDLELHKYDQEVNDVEKYENSTLIAVVEDLEEIVNGFDDQNALVDGVWISVVISPVLVMMVYSLFDI